MQLMLLDSPALLRIALRIILTASLLRYRCKIFCFKFYTVTLTGVRTGTVSPLSSFPWITATSVSHHATFLR